MALVDAIRRLDERRPERLLHAGLLRALRRRRESESETTI